jgi:hypothetical protein
MRYLLKWLKEKDWPVAGNDVKKLVYGVDVNG